MATWKEYFNTHGISEDSEMNIGEVIKNELGRIKEQNNTTVTANSNTTTPDGQTVGSNSGEISTGTQSSQSTNNTNTQGDFVSTANFMEAFKQMANAINTMSEMNRELALTGNDKPQYTLEESIAELMREE